MREPDSDLIKNGARKGAIWPYFLGASLLLLLWLGVKTVRVVEAVNTLTATQSEVEEVLAGGLSEIDADAVEGLLIQTRTAVLTLKSEAKPFLPLAPYFGWLPKIGNTIKAAPELLAMADSGTASAAYAFRAAKPVLKLVQDEEASGIALLPRMVSLVDAAGDDLAQAESLMGETLEARAHLGDTDGLHWRIRSLIEQSDPWLSMAKDGLAAAQRLPELLGSEVPKRYLIITQNEDELRATGGFISGAGVLILDEGHIIELGFHDAYSVDNWREKPYEFPPEPLYALMGLELFLFRDANFWPDFPTSAEKMMDLYSYGLDVAPLDGVIAIDQRMVQLLLQATGPIKITESDLVLDSSNVINSFREAWSFQGDPESPEWREWYRNRKAFIGEFAAALRGKFESDLSSVEPERLAKNIWEAAAGKHLQIYVRDEEAAALLKELGWDGSLPDPHGRDLLAVVESNVGYNKANVFVNLELSYEVDLSIEGMAQAELSATLVNGVAARDEACLQDISYSPDQVSDYMNLAKRCYWTYLRLYVPEGSRMMEASSHAVPAESLISGGREWSAIAEGFSEKAGLTTFENFLMIPWGRSEASVYRYQLAESVARTARDEQRYQLIVVKQAGTRPADVVIKVTLPDDAIVIEATPQPVSIQGAVVQFELSLTEDTLVSISFDLTDGNSLE